MAGSYNHITTESGALKDFDAFTNSIENLGDAYEMAREMFGMIWFLAAHLDHADAIEQARQNYLKGLVLAATTSGEGKG